MRVLFFCGVIFLSMAWVHSASGATFCVSNSAELVTALDDAASNGASDTIRVRTGNYDAPVGGFGFDQAFNDNADITILGGWTPFFDNPCGLRLTGDPFDTALNGNGTDRVLSMFPNETTNIRIESIHFLAGNSNGLKSACGGGLYISNPVNYTGDVEIVRNAFTNNVAGSFGGGFCGGGGDRFELLNNLFFANSADCDTGAASITHGGDAYIISNTVAFNSVGDDCTQTIDAAGGLRFGGVGDALMVNNIFWGNENIDLDLDSANAALIANNYLNLSGFPPGSGSGVNFDVNPEFSLQNLFDLRLSRQSPLLDRGVVPLSTASWELATADLDGLARIQGSSVDLGAYETDDVIFASSFSD